MSDLGSKAALNSDIDAKVTTNGANENTGARVNDCLNNIVDTLYGSGSAPTATFSTTTNTAQDPGQDTVRFNSGTIGSVTEIALSDVVGGVDKGDLNSRFSGIIQFRPVGSTDTIEFQITDTPVHTTWTRYTVTYLKGALPANGTVMAVRFLPSNTINAAVTTALAGKADGVGTVCIIKMTNVTGDAPTLEYLLNTMGATFTSNINDPGDFYFESSVPFDETTTFVTASPDLNAVLSGIDAIVGGSNLIYVKTYSAGVITDGAYATWLIKIEKLGS